MPRHNFLSQESFVNANERQTKDSLLSIPAFASNIRLLAENKMIESYKFSYNQPEKNLQYYVDVSVLPLNDQFTRISLHVTYSNGQAFKNDAAMVSAVKDFEAAITAAIKGDVSMYKPCQLKAKPSKNVFSFLTAFITSISVIILKKNFPDIGSMPDTTTR